MFALELPFLFRMQVLSLSRVLLSVRTWLPGLGSVYRLEWMSVSALVLK
ncbi:hypothetical protein [Halovenus salina]|uniref:Uncharacterized protein n=1 Tax=Halovenus salina TaxID=1510225 RepID=A0ABD5W6U6_9EURY